MKALMEAERSGRPFLVFRDGDDRQRIFSFAAGSASASVGRRPSSDLVIDWDDQVSRLHARFEYVDGAWTLVDDGLSSNGTFVNDERVSGRRRLNDADTVRFGSTLVRFRSPTGPPREPAEAPRTPSPVALSSTQRRILAALCRPYTERSGLASPATDEQMAEALFLSVGEVRAHLQVLYAKLDIKEAAPGEARVQLLHRAVADGLISERDL
jgi:hypothetical protein